MREFAVNAGNVIACTVAASIWVVMVACAVVSSFIFTFAPVYVAYRLIF